MSNENPFLIITMGDAAGIGPEIILKSLADAYPQTCRPLVVGSLRIFERVSQVVKSPLTLNPVQSPEEGNYRPGIMNILDTKEPSPESSPFGQVSPAAGKGAMVAYRMAYQISLDYPVKAILTAPTNKQAMHEAGFIYNDDFDFISELTGTRSYIVLLFSERLRIATVPPLHVSLKQACQNLTAGQIMDALGMLRSALVSFGILKPVIGVAALNPHAGEGGKFGDEEKRVIIPAVKDGKMKGLDVRGPFPADSIFFRASKGEFDAVLTMYHDQGRIALKSSDFGQIIIIMVGTPVTLVAVAHGTAFDIAGRGTADPSNFIKALRFSDGIMSRRQS
jgi:4-hydroxythreonine-4-phosphate dehydrogenase